MITETGKNILSKYLIGQAPAYASYIAAGCGATPLSISQDPNDYDYSAKTALDFEMFRAPVVSRGYVTTNGVTEIVLTAEMPTEERYEITEVGVYSAGANPSAGANDSRSLFSFTSNESWEYHSNTVATSIPVISRPLDNNDENTQNEIIDDGNVVFTVNADNTLFDNEIRIARNERPRFLNNIVMARGDLSVIDKVGDILTPEAGTPHIHLTALSYNLDKNSADDEIRLAFSVINQDSGSTAPTKVRVVVEFSSEDSNSSTRQYASLQTEVLASQMLNNRYFVVSKRLEDLIKTPVFSWAAVTLVKVFVSVLDSSGNPDDGYYVALDAARFENLNTFNSLYGLTGYSVIRTQDGRPVTKESNTANLIEFRFAMDVI